MSELDAGWFRDMIHEARQADEAVGISAAEDDDALAEALANYVQDENPYAPDSPSEDDAEAIGKALHFEYVNGLLTPESPVKASAYDMWERPDRDQHRMWDEIDPDRRRSYTAIASRLLARLRAPDSEEPVAHPDSSQEQGPVAWGVLDTTCDLVVQAATNRVLAEEDNERFTASFRPSVLVPLYRRAQPDSSQVDPLGYVVLAGKDTDYSDGIPFFPVRAEAEAFRRECADLNKHFTYTVEPVGIAARGS